MLYLVNRAFSHDLNLAILVSQIMKRRPCWCPVGVEPFYVNTFLLQ